MPLRDKAFVQTCGALTRYTLKHKMPNTKDPIGSCLQRFDKVKGFNWYPWMQLLPNGEQTAGGSRCTYPCLAHRNSSLTPEPP